VTLEQVEKRQAKAARFARNVLQDDDLADSLESESPEDYASRKHLVISNSSLNQRRQPMVNGDLTKSDLEEMVDQASDVLSAAYVPESDRETLAEAVGNALDILAGDGDDSDDADDDATENVSDYSD
jgi:hypothetical protein